MNMRRLLFCAIVVGVALAGFLIFRKTNQRSVLQNAEQFTLYSLSPGMEPEPQRNWGKPGLFYGYKILGQVKITDPKLKADLVNALYNGVASGRGQYAGCFNPRHGIRAVKGERTVDAVICFECFAVHFYENGVRSHVETSREPQPLFDAALANAKVPLAP